MDTLSVLATDGHFLKPLRITEQSRTGPAALKDHGTEFWCVEWVREGGKKPEQRHQQEFPESLNMNGKEPEASQLQTTGLWLPLRLLSQCGESRLKTPLICPGSIVCMLTWCWPDRRGNDERPRTSFLLHSPPQTHHHESREGRWLPSLSPTDPAGGREGGLSPRAGNISPEPAPQNTALRVTHLPLPGRVMVCFLSFGH